MTSPKSRTGVAGGSNRSARPVGKAAFYLGKKPNLPKGVAGIKVPISEAASKLLANNPDRVKAVLQRYGQAIAKSRAVGHTVHFQVSVDPAGAATVTPVEVAPRKQDPSEGIEASNAELQNALAAARDRGRLRAAEILSSEDMLSAEDFAKLLGTSRVTVNAKRQSGQILGLDGAKRGFRFPTWQINAEGKPFSELSSLHDLLGGAWAVFRFLVQPHGELDGLTGRDALERGKSGAVLAAAESLGRDFR